MEVDHPLLGRIRLPGNPVHYSRSTLSPGCRRPGWASTPASSARRCSAGRRMMTADPAVTSEPADRRALYHAIADRTAWTGSASGSRLAIQRLAGLPGAAAAGPDSGWRPACRDDRGGNGRRRALRDRRLRVRVHGRLDGRRGGHEDRAGLSSPPTKRSRRQCRGLGRIEDARGHQRAGADAGGCGRDRRRPRAGIPHIAVAVTRRPAARGRPGRGGRCAHRRAGGPVSFSGSRTRPAGADPGSAEFLADGSGRTASSMSCRRWTGSAPWSPRSSGCCRRARGRERRSRDATRPAARRSAGSGRDDPGRDAWVQVEGARRARRDARPAGWPATSRRPSRSAATAAAGWTPVCAAGSATGRATAGYIAQTGGPRPGRIPDGDAAARPGHPLRAAGPHPDRHARRGGHARGRGGRHGPAIAELFVAVAACRSRLLRWSSARGCPAGPSRWRHPRPVAGARRLPGGDRSRAGHVDPEASGPGGSRVARRLRLTRPNCSAAASSAHRAAPGSPQGIAG